MMQADRPVTTIDALIGNWSNFLPNLCSRPVAVFVVGLGALRPWPQRPLRTASARKPILPEQERHETTAFITSDRLVQPQDENTPVPPRKRHFAGSGGKRMKSEILHNAVFCVSVLLSSPIELSHKIHRHK